ncbi:MAG: hypothetical protein ACP5R5_03045 [Armatimonadota bacterium]
MSILLRIALAAGLLAAAGSPAACGRITVSPRQFSPNGDGVRDELRIILESTPGDLATVRVYNSTGALVVTLAEDLELDLPKTELTWDGLAVAGTAPSGTYTIKASFRGTTTSQSSAKVVLDNSHKWPQLKLTARPFFPIGVWFEGNPDWAGYPRDKVGARKYYDRCFADLRRHGFNAVVVPNCPESLWETLLKSARASGLKVVLEVAPLVELVSDTPVTESRIYAAAKRVCARLGKYSSLARYQIRDEPPPSAVPNWLLVQRILGAVDPAHPAFSCFNSYESLAAVSESTKLAEAVFDIYPLRTATPPQTLGGFVGALDAFKDAARGSVLWPVLQAFAKPDAWRYPTLEELRAMTYLSLVSGAKGVFYFLYQSMPNHPEKLEGLVNPAGEPNAVYSAASTLAGELKRLSDLLLSLKPDRDYTVSAADARIGHFTDPSGRPVMIIASTRPDAPVTAAVKVTSDSPWRDALTGDSFTPRDSVLEVPLSPGAGRVLVRH